MREELWLRLRNSRIVRKLYSIPALARPIKAASLMLLPSSGQRMLRVRGGLARGLVLEVNPRWEHAIWEGTYEQPIQELLARLLKPGMTVYDVGGGIGFHAMLAARLGARVFTFEPDEENSRCIEHLVELNSLQRSISLMRCAVFSHSGNIALDPASTPRGHGNAHVRTGDGNPDGTRIVRCVTLDDFARDNPVPRLVKIDVEGAESDVLKGADQVFRTARPYVLCEVHDSANAEFIEPWIRERGYLFQWIDEGGRWPRHFLASPQSQREPM
jgi:FkbM family methyltransferase